MKTYIANAQILLPDARIVSTSLRMANGVIAAIGDEEAMPGDTVIDGHGYLLTPGLVDVHVHGIGHTNFDKGPEGLREAGAWFGRFGTTTVLPTLVPRMGIDMLKQMAALACALPTVKGVRMPGLHLEGPFMALSGAGCDLVPGDVGLLEEILAACEHRVTVMSVSPDTPGILPVIERLCTHGVAPFVTHTRATLAQSQAAIAAGARHATHFSDVFPLPPETDPGVRPVGAVEAYLADPGTTVDFIADGCHVHPIVIQMAVRAKTCAGVALVTDANIGAGLPAGIYDTPWGYPVKVEPGNGARIAAPDHPSYGGLAGSALTMNVAMANVLKWIDAPAGQIWAMGTQNPARIAGLKGVGELAVGRPADMVLWRKNITPALTWVGGVCVWRDDNERL